MRLGVKREHGVHACTVGHTYVRVVVKSFHDQSPILFVYKVLKGCMYNVIFCQKLLNYSGCRTYYYNNASFRTNL